MSDKEIMMVVCFNQCINGMMSAFYVCSMLAENRYILLRRWIQFSVFMTLNMIVNASFTTLPWLRGLITEIANFYFTLFCFSRPWKERLLTLFSTLAIAVLLELCTYSCIFLIVDSWQFMRYDLQLNNMVMGAGAIIVNMLFFLVYTLIIALKKMILHQIRKKELLAYIIVPVYQFFILILYLRTYPELNRTMLYMGTLLFMMNLILAVFILFSADSLISRTQGEKKLSELEGKRQEELEYYQQLQSNLRKMRTMKHDFSNQLQTLYMLLQSNTDTTAITRLLDSLCVKSSEINE